VSVLVVHPLEVINVDHGDRQRGVVATGPLDLDRQYLVDVAAGAEPGQAIDRREALEGRVLQHQLVLQPLDLQVQLHPRNQLRRMERLRDRVRRAVLDQLGAPVEVGGSAQNQEGDVGAARTRLAHPQQLLAVELRHLEIAEYEVDHLAHQELESLEPIRRLQDVETGPQPSKRLADLRSLRLGIVDQK
jgi:hypothetical protein